MGLEDLFDLGFYVAGGELRRFGLAKGGEREEEKEEAFPEHAAP